MLPMCRFRPMLIRVWLLDVIFLVHNSYGTSISADTQLQTTLSIEFGDLVTLSPLNSYTQVFCNQTHPAYCSTKLNIDKKNRTVARAVPLEQAAFFCPALQNKTYVPRSLSWHYVNQTNLIGTFNLLTGEAETLWNNNGAYEVLTDGGLLLKNVNRKLVER